VVRRKGGTARNEKVIKKDRLRAENTLFKSIIIANTTVRGTEPGKEILK
jgi:hypothetical protein